MRSPGPPETAGLADLSSRTVGPVTANAVRCLALHGNRVLVADDSGCRATKAVSSPTCRNAPPPGKLTHSQSADTAHRPSKAVCETLTEHRIALAR